MFWASNACLSKVPKNISEIVKILQNLLQCTFKAQAYYSSNGLVYNYAYLPQLLRKHTEVPVRFPYIVLIFRRIWIICYTKGTSKDELTSIYISWMGKTFTNLLFSLQSTYNWKLHNDEFLVCFSNVNIIYKYYEVSF